jgi:hypothetical protein
VAAISRTPLRNRPGLFNLVKVALKRAPAHVRTAAVDRVKQEFANLQ